MSEPVQQEMMFSYRVSDMERVQLSRWGDDELCRQLYIQASLNPHSTSVAVWHDEYRKETIVREMP